MDSRPDSSRILDGAVAFDAGRVTWVGPSEEAPPGEVTMDGSGCVGLPGLVDCHTHAVWAGSRADEFGRRLAGERYTDILEAGGGILSTVRATRAADAEALAALGGERLQRMRSRGVTTVEVKSGYGLSPEAEERMLHAAREAGRRAGVRVLTTFLGAHAIPAEHRHDRAGYLREVIEEQLPRVAGLADFVDVYVDEGAFTVEEGRAVLEAGRRHGLGVRVHAEQVAHTGAAAMASALGATSADHLERIDDAGIAALAAHGTVAVLLPGAMLYLRDSAPPVDRLRAAGVPMAVATDLNPGTSPVDDLWTCATLACITMGLTVDEALLGITANAGLALGRPDLGVLRPGAAGDMVLVETAPGEPTGPDALIQYLGAPKIRAVIHRGQVVETSR
jgi:imidazolonepropionase